MIFLILTIEIFVQDKKKLDKIIKDYISEGFLDTDSFKRNDSLFIEIGNRYYIGNIILHSPILPEETFLKTFYKRPFTDKNIEQITDSIINFYADNGFPFADIIPEFSNYDSIIDIDFTGILKDLCFIKKITIIGNVKNKNILKNLNKLIDSPFSKKLLVEEIRKINSSNFLKVDSFRLTQEDNGVNIFLFITNVSLGDISGGLGYQNETGWNFNFSGDFYNPFGYGTIWKIKFEKISGEKTFQLRLNLPLLTTGNNFNISYSLITSLDTLIKNNFSFRHIYKYNDYRIGNGIRYSDEIGKTRKRIVFYNLLIRYKKNYIDLFNDLRENYIFIFNISFDIKQLTFNTLTCFTSRNMKDEYNFFPIVRGYANTYNEGVITSSFTYNFYRKKGFTIYGFFDYNIYPYFNKKYSAGFGVSKDRLNIEIAYPIEFGIRNIMLVVRISPVDYFQNP